MSFNCAAVTGANGFIGSYLVRLLLGRNVPVHALVRPGGNKRLLDGLDVGVTFADLLDMGALMEGIRGCDVVFHLAALYAVGPEAASRMYAVNVRGTENVLRVAREAGVGRIVHVSTVGTIGRPADGSPPTEDTPFNMWDSASDYVKSKYQGEVKALEAAKSGMSVVVVHPCAPVGAGDYKPTATGRRLLLYLRGEPVPYPPGGINFVAVEDVAAGMWLAAVRGRVGERYILGNREGNLDRWAFYALMRKVSGLPYPERRGLRARVRMLFRGKETPSGHAPVALTADPSRAVEELGMPQTPLEQAFRRAVEWYREGRAKQILGARRAPRNPQNHCCF